MLGERSKLKLRGAGVAILPAALSAEQQQELLADCMRTIGDPQRASGVHLGQKLPPSAAWSYESAKSSSSQRPACLDCAAELFHSLGQHHRLGALFEADSREQSSSLKILPVLGKIGFRNVWARLYSESNALGWHRDPYHGLSGWVMIINLGSDATLAWRHGGQGAMVHRAQLTSGDAIFFNGEVLEHCVESVHDDSTCPAFFREAMAGSPFRRVGLQMRA